MQNNSSRMKSMKQREDEGWVRLHQQLDVELPVKKDKDRKFLWIFLFGGALLGGYGLSQYTGSHLKKNEVKSDIAPIETLTPEFKAKEESPVLKSDSIENKVATLQESKSEGKASVYNPNGNRLGENNYLSDQPFEKKKRVSKGIHANSSSGKLTQFTSIKNGNSADFTTPSNSLSAGSNIPASTTSTTAIEPVNRFNDGVKSNTATDYKTSSSLQNESHHERGSLSMDGLPQRFEVFIMEPMLFLPVIPLNSSSLVSRYEITDEVIQLKSNPGWLLQSSYSGIRPGYSAIGLSGGYSFKLTSRLALNTLLGTFYQYGNNLSSNPLNSLGNSGAPTTLDAKSNYTLSFNSIYLDADKSAMTRIVNGSLYIASNDKLYSTQAPHLNLGAQSSVAYDIIPRLFIESGIYASRSISKNNTQLWVESTSNTNGLLSSHTTGFKISDNAVSTHPVQLHALFQAGYRLSNRWALLASYSSGNLIKQSSSLLYANPALTPQSNAVTQLILPRQEGNSFWRMAVQYHF
jgi:hypothetical protein